MELTTIETKSYFYKAPNQPFKQVASVLVYISLTNIWKLKANVIDFFGFMRYFFFVKQLDFENIHAYQYLICTQFKNNRNYRIHRWSLLLCCQVILLETGYFLADRVYPKDTFDNGFTYPDIIMLLVTQVDTDSYQIA